eukprot:TRINITY_DN3705_c0_g2_i4.p1 TRINITY_DN3705_c0_g2~~TRINITY_DN3705_c0_g2_i4.p1  ORF type:complete len:810 (+),score=253.55 TRINITY_DN3705_c0_g2_i4:50-2431(+)
MGPKVMWFVFSCALFLVVCGAGPSIVSVSSPDMNGDWMNVTLDACLSNCSVVQVTIYSWENTQSQSVQMEVYPCLSGNQQFLGTLSNVSSGLFKTLTNMKNQTIQIQTCEDGIIEGKFDWKCNKFEGKWDCSQCNGNPLPVTNSDAVPWFIAGTRNGACFSDDVVQEINRIAELNLDSSESLSFYCESLRPYLLNSSLTSDAALIGCFNDIDDIAVLLNSNMRLSLPMAKYILTLLVSKLNLGELYHPLVRITLGIFRNDSVDSFSINAPKVSFSAEKLRTLNKDSTYFNGTQEASFTIPSQVVQNVGVINGSSIFIVLGANPFAEHDSSPTYSSIVGLSMIDKEGADLVVKDLSSPITIRIPINSSSSLPSGFEYNCRWWDESQLKWREEGCTAVLDSNAVKCMCNHLTNFSLGAAPIKQQLQLPNPQPSFESWKIAAIVVPILSVFLIVFVVFVIIILMRKRQREVITDLEKTSEFVLEVKKSKANLLDKTQITDYVKLGESSSATVYSALYQSTTKVAVKRFKDLEEHSLLRNEMDILQELHHPNIIQTLGRFFDEEEKNWNLVLPFYGNDLSTVIAKSPSQVFIGKDGKRIEQQILIKIGLDVVSALTYLNDQGIVYGNLTSSNLLISEGDIGSFDCKLVGFGRAYYTSDEPKPDGKEAEKRWKAPEVIKSSASSLSGDVWSFGVLLWQLCQWKSVPYEELEEEDILPLLLKGEKLEFTNDSAAPEVRELAERCWKIDPKERPSLQELLGFLNPRFDKSFVVDSKARDSIILGYNSIHSIPVETVEYVE